MVAVLHNAPALATPQAVEAWLAHVSAGYSPEERKAIAAAIEFALPVYNDRRTDDGDTLLERALGTAAILAGLKLDADSICAAILIGVPQCGPGALAAFADHNEGTVVSLVTGVARMSDIRALPTGASGASAASIGQESKEQSATQVENLRKMLLTMVEDIRVVLIKLAERTQALRFLMNGDGARKTQVAREVLDLFAPLANRLGVWQLKWELEDLSLRALEPDTYKRIAQLLHERRLDRERYIEDVIATIRGDLTAAGITAEITGRPKHIYSIYNKMRRKQAGIDEIYDIRAIRLLVPDVKDCYAALGMVHQRWTPLPGEFDDYIAKPKGNNYRSLHTAVMGPEGKPLEIQIRTYDMHRHSEYGVAAHWRYKEGAAKGAPKDPGFDDRIAWLRQVLDWKNAVADAGEWLQQFKSSLFTDTIYLLTPQGKVVDLPRGATPVDFAYAVHTNLGHRCRGARVNGAMVPLNHVLSNGQQVEIITAKQGGPSRDWLNPDLGYVQSSRARAKVRQWFKAQQLAETIAQGRSVVERELQRSGATALNLDALADHGGFGKVDDFYVAIARGEVNHRQLQMSIRALADPGAATEAPMEETMLPRRSKAAGSGSGILIVGVDRLMTGLARCCKPAPPDPIVGFVTRGKGISIHRQACSNIVRMKERQPERLITADWGLPRDEVFAVDVHVDAMDRQGLLRDISEVFSREKINVTAVNTLSRNMQARMSFTLEVRGIEQLKRALAMVQDVNGVMSATRR